MVSLWVRDPVLSVQDPVEPTFWFRRQLDGLTLDRELIRVVHITEIVEQQVQVNRFLGQLNELVCTGWPKCRCHCIEVAPHTFVAVICTRVVPFLMLLYRSA